MSPETIARINPGIVQAVRNANAFLCRSAYDAALVFELRGWEQNTEDGPYCVDEIGEDIVYIVKNSMNDWSAMKYDVSSMVNHGILDIRTLKCNPPYVGSSNVGSQSANPTIHFSTTLGHSFLEECPSAVGAGLCP